MSTAQSVYCSALEIEDKGGTVSLAVISLVRIPNAAQAIARGSGQPERKTYNAGGTMGGPGTKGSKMIQEGNLWDGVRKDAGWKRAAGSLRIGIAPSPPLTPAHLAFGAEGF